MRPVIGWLKKLAHNGVLRIGEHKSGIGVHYFCLWIFHGKELSLFFSIFSSLSECMLGLASEDCLYRELSYVLYIHDYTSF